MTDARAPQQFQQPPDHVTRGEIVGALEYWVKRAKTAEAIIAAHCPRQEATPSRTKDKPAGWEEKWSAYQDFVNRHPQYKDTWPSFYDGAVFGENLSRQEAQWVIVSDGEGVQACVIANGDLHESVHRFMCMCGKPWQDCEADMVWDIAQLDKPEEWATDEDGEAFSITWPHETGKITIYKLSGVMAGLSDTKEK